AGADARAGAEGPAEAAEPQRFRFNDSGAGERGGRSARPGLAEGGGDQSAAGGAPAGETGSPGAMGGVPPPGRREPRNEASAEAGQGDRPGRAESHGGGEGAGGWGAPGPAERAGHGGPGGG